ncbi:MAG: polysaccharide pyruvyl transferase CsaB [Clostridia bacterium]|nr:polysaccharide pyruvyl transferase CsaB [Clostridia bacterium]
MKVLHLIAGGDSGGAKTHLFSLLDKLKAKATVRVACLIDGVFYQELQDQNVDNVLFLQRNRFDLSVVSGIADMINQEEFDVFHVHGARANFVAEFVMKRINIPTVTTVHSDYLLDFDEPVKKFFFTNLNKHALSKIPYHIAVSDNFKDMLIERGFRANGIYTVYNGMDFSSVPKEILSKEAYAKKHGFIYDKNKVYVGIAARFDAVKGVDVFIKAAGEVLKRHKNVEFLIAGDGVDREKLEALAEKTGFSNAIRFLGFERDMYAFWNIIDINCLTSMCESFPYSMLEGAALGKPMVASRVGGIPSFIIDDETGYLFTSGDYKEMAEKLSVMLDNPALLLEMGKNIQERAITLFSSEKFAQDHMQIYESIIKDYHDEKRYDFAVSGYYGFRNNGDDALLMALTEQIKKENKDARLVVLSNRPKETAQIYRIDAIHRLRALKIRRAFKQTRGLIFGGGSLLQDETSSKSLWYYLSIIKLAKKCGMKVMQFANGFGPINKPSNQRITVETINQCVNVITTRDKASLRRMQELNIRQEMTLTADPAMLLCGCSDKELSKLFSRLEIPEEPYMTIAVREWKKNTENFSQEVAKALCAFAEQHDLNVLLIPMQHPHDVTISKEIQKLVGKRAYVIKENIGIKETIGVIGRSKVNVAMRLHSMIYSVAQGVKTVALRYDPKIDGFMDYVGLHYICNVEDLEHKTLLEKIEQAYSEPMSKTYLELREKAKQNVTKALDMIRE